jgi:hypothetical protein
MQCRAGDNSTPATYYIQTLRGSFLRGFGMVLRGFGMVDLWVHAAVLTP